MANEGQKDIPGLKAHKPNVAELRCAANYQSGLHPLYVQHLLRWAADEIERLERLSSLSIQVAEKVRLDNAPTEYVPFDTTAEPPVEGKKVEFREFI